MLVGPDDREVPFIKIARGILGDVEDFLWEPPALSAAAASPSTPGAVGPSRNIVNHGPSRSNSDTRSPIQ